MTIETTPVNRRGFIGGAIGAVAAGTVASSLGALGARAANDPASIRRKPKATDYGPLSPVRDEATGLSLLLLPKGFEYISYGWTGDPMATGAPTPSAHDGMAAFRRGKVVHLVRNHERGNGTPFADPDSVYDPTASGGTTNLVFDPQAGEWLESYPSLSGTIRNCCGGPTPWGSWLTCEETTQVNAPGTADEVRHGFVYDVPADGTSDAVPLTQLGRYSHEALCVDPASGIVYLTEDATPSGFYRFVPRRRGDLTEGRLQMMAIDGVPTYTPRRPARRGRSATGSTSTSPTPALARPRPSPRGRRRAAPRSPGARARGSATAGRTSSPPAADRSARGRCSSTTRGATSSACCSRRPPRPSSTPPTT